ncbi:uroporphyrinogen-III C-methyltransferase [Echinicola vietnamensis]|uniref:uroporphyrinogen-III C-methyltransferase n=1 Tax=Echinicola vietnamensis (strain DSM 17526 / LMG 23754 / KMM 6221) TaxID=926556 RepID=L0FXY5_ECHVK|nr:uroporphyrinogen-III C-methyltransferase [Echinicola vietnamensis]AGA78157.1 uroporphyrin-III C-methyltransferase [Echinicola vietnamensis DSM 17526]
MTTLIKRLSIVGAGPGDPDLITLKGMKTLESADVVLYDALANEALLEYVPETAVKVFVGKRAGMHYCQQREINRMIVNYAENFGHVVRLKGGDPYVFGRGHEELEYAAAHGIPTEYVPGISSAMAVPGLGGIPLTKRGVNESFWVVTGTLKDHSTAKDLSFAAQSSATVIILMGMKKLPEIVSLFEQYRGKDEAVAIIQDGSKESERSIVGDLGGILDIQQHEQLTAPAIIVIGEVVKEKGKALGHMLAERALVP